MRPFLGSLLRRLAAWVEPVPTIAVCRHPATRLPTFEAENVNHTPGVSVDEMMADAGGSAWWEAWPPGSAYPDARGPREGG